MKHDFSRREWLTASGVALGATLVPDHIAHAAPAATEAKKSSPSFRYCLNTSTIRGQELGILAEIELIAKAGYDSIEPWIRELEVFRNQGGSLKDLGKRIHDLGLSVESAIGFANWI